MDGAQDESDDTIYNTSAMACDIADEGEWDGKTEQEGDGEWDSRCRGTTGLSHPSVSLV